MGDLSELKRLATRIVEVQTSQDVPISKLFDDFDAATSPEVVLALIAENDRLESEAVYSAAGFDSAREEIARLRAEVAGLRTGYEAYEQVNADLKAENETLIAAAQALRDEWRKDQDDAKRYRWLIRNAEEIYFQGHHLHLDPYYVGQEKIKEDADSEIDAALGQGEQS